MQHIFVRVTVLKEKPLKEAVLHLESTELRRAGHLWDISSKGVVLSRRNDVEISRANSLHAVAYTASIIKDLICIWKVAKFTYLISDFKNIKI